MNQASKKAVILFTGDPRREASQKQLPSRFLTELHRELIRTVSRCRGIDLMVASESHGQFHLAGEAASTTAAISSLSEKVDFAFQFAFFSGYESVVLLAGDVAGLDSDLLSNAFDRLQALSPQAVVGPSPDGGFYLLGLNRLADVPWNVIPWFESEAGTALIRELGRRGFELSFLCPIGDIDSFADALSTVRSLSCASLKSRLLSLLCAAAIHASSERGSVFTRPHTQAQLRAPPPSL